MLLRFAPTLVYILCPIVAWKGQGEASIVKRVCQPFPSRATRRRHTFPTFVLSLVVTQDDEVRAILPLSRNICFFLLSHLQISSLTSDIVREPLHGPGMSWLCKTVRVSIFQPDVFPFISSHYVYLEHSHGILGVGSSKRFVEFHEGIQELHFAANVINPISSVCKSWTVVVHALFSILCLRFAFVNLFAIRDVTGNFKGNW